MEKSKSYKSFLSSFKELDEQNGWDLRIQCYYIGRLSSEFKLKAISYEEWVELCKMVPISEEDLQFIN